MKATRKVGNIGYFFPHDLLRQMSWGNCDFAPAISTRPRDITHPQRAGTTWTTHFFNKFDLASEVPF